MSEIFTPRACVAGWPVAQSRSPLIHGYWLASLGIQGSYDRAAVPPGGFSRFAETIGKNDLVGANVTIPHKESAFAVCDELTAIAADLGAVNTLWRQNGALCGDNTDVAGFLDNLDEEAPGWDVRPPTAVVLGAGGAARAILKGLLTRGVDRISIVNRTLERAERLAAHFGLSAAPHPLSAAPSLLRGAGLLINASSLGMSGQPPLDLDIRALPEAAIVADIVYIPLETQLLARAKERRLRTVGGLGMLLHQAAPAFERWFGARPVVTAELRGLIAADIVGALGAAP
jgi:shikimate dehydrogenase